MAAFGCKADVRIEPKPICGSPLTARSGSSQFPIYPDVSYRNLIVYELLKGFLKSILNDPPRLSIGLTSIRTFDFLVVLLKFNIGIRAGFDFVHDVDNRRALIRRLVPNATAIVVGHTGPNPSR